MADMLDRLKASGLWGFTRGEVARRILEDWLWENEKQVNYWPRQRRRVPVLKTGQ
jgi:hypothetical protein